MMKRDTLFGRFAKWVATLTGSPAAFVLAAGMIIVWLVSGPVFDYSDTWQLVINTSTTIITFLMVFIIQHTQNKDTIAMQLKLDELIRAVEGAQEAMIDLEELSDDELYRVRKRYLKLASEARDALNGEDIHVTLIGNEQEKRQEEEEAMSRS
ncbi:MAG: low affinity iron permease family protein [Rickettsiales bacterium]